MIKVKQTEKGFEYFGSVKELEKLIQEYKKLGGTEEVFINYIPGGRVEAAPDIYRKGYGPNPILPSNQSLKK